MVFHRRRTPVYLARIPTALALAAGYAYTAVTLAWPVGELPHELDRYDWHYAVVSALFAVWHLLGYLGYITDGARKIGYLVSAAWMGGFALSLFVDGAPLAAGYVAIGCAAALGGYWHYPRRRESEPRGQ